LPLSAFLARITRALERSRRGKDAGAAVVAAVAAVGPPVEAARDELLRAVPRFEGAAAASSVDASELAAEPRTRPDAPRVVANENDFLKNSRLEI